MTYSILFTRKAQSQLIKLERGIQKRIAKTLERIRIRPQNFAKRMVGNPYYCVRAGDYRLIINIQQQKLIILVLEMGHRKRIYQRK